MHPCQNPNCHSFGKPHPNCRCHADMAQGGEVSHFCSSDRAHDPACEYFAGGGAVPEGAIPIEQFEQAASVPEGAIPVDQFQSSEDVYGTPGQTAIAGLEGLAKGVAGPLATLAEVKGLGVKPEDIKGRAEESPIAHGAGEAAGLIGSAFIPGAELTQAGLLSKAGEGVAEAIGVQGVKAVATKLGVENALYALGDEASKAIMNDPSTIQAAALHVGLSGLIGVGAGIPLGMASKAWTEKIAPKAEAFVKDFSDTLKSNASDYVATTEEEPIKNLFRPGTSPLKRSRFKEPPPPAPETEEAAESILSAGNKAAQKFSDHISNLVSDAVGSGIGAIFGRLTGIPGASALGAWVGHNSVKPIVRTYLPSIIKTVLNKEASAAGLKSAFDAMEAIVSGESAMEQAARSLFEAGTSKAIDAAIPKKSDLQELDDAVHGLGDSPNAMINLGGQMGHYMPDHQTNLASTVQNAVNYLNEQRPKPVKPGVLAQDVPPTHAEIAAFQRTLAIAQQPLIVLGQIKKGTLFPKDVQDLQKLYPALVPAIINKVNKHMIDSLSKGQRVPFKMRRGLSMLMGQDLDGIFSPASLQAAQATHLPAQSPQQAQSAPKGRSSGINKMGKFTKLAQTPSEARQEALQKA